MSKLPPAMPVECFIFKKSRYLNQQRKRYFVMDIERGKIITKTNKTNNAQITETIWIRHYKPECSKQLLDEMKKKHGHGVFVMEPWNPSAHPIFTFCNEYKTLKLLDAEFITKIASKSCYPTSVLAQAIEASRLFKTIKEALNKKDYITARAQLIKFPFMYLNTRFENKNHFEDCCSLQEYDLSFVHLQKYFDFALDLVHDSEDNTFEIYALKEYCRFLGQSKYEKSGYSTFSEAKKNKQKMMRLYERILAITNESDGDILEKYGSMMIYTDSDYEKGIKYILKSIQLNGDERGTQARNYWIAQGLYRQKKYLQSEKMLHDNFQKYGGQMNYQIYRECEELLEKIEKQKQILLQNKILQNDMKLNFDITNINIHQNEQKMNDLNYNHAQNEEKENVSCVVFKEWLKNNNLIQYLDVFKAKKFADIRLIQFMDENSLKNDILSNTPFDSQIHYNFLLTKINELKKDIVEFKEWLKLIEMEKYYNIFENNGIITKQMMIKNEKCLNEKRIANLIGNIVEAEFLFQALRHQSQNNNQQQEGQIEPQPQQIV
eukprot:369506_1